MFENLKVKSNAHVMLERSIIPLGVTVSKGRKEVPLIWPIVTEGSPFRWPRVLRRVSAATRLLALRFRIPPGAWMSVPCECCVLSGRSLCGGPITCLEESY